MRAYVCVRACVRVLSRVYIHARLLVCKRDGEKEINRMRDLFCFCAKTVLKYGEMYSGLKFEERFIIIFLIIVLKPTDNTPNIRVFMLIVNNDRMIT